MAFVKGQLYARRTLHEAYGGNPRSGIAPCANHPIVLLFKTVPGKQIYRDRREADGTLMYSGAGLRGDMQLTGANRIVAEHRRLGKALHMFEQDEATSLYVYEGEYTCTGVSTEPAKDQDGQMRAAIFFRLTPVETLGAAPTDADDLDGLDEAELLRKARAAAQAIPPRGETSSSYRRRAAPVRAYALAWAKGICQGCGAPGPFTRNKTPFLEVHHVLGLAEGGADAPEHVIAICPNCHRRAHLSDDAAEWNAHLEEVLRRRHV